MTGTIEREATYYYIESIVAIETMVDLFTIVTKLAQKYDIFLKGELKTDVF